MKFPKLINGPSSVGESLARSLAGVDAPFLTKDGMTSSAQKKNGVTEVRQKQGLVYLWMATAYVTGPLSYAAANNSIDMANLLRSPALMKQTYSYGAFGLAVENSYKLVGDNYILVTWSSASANSTDPNTVHWPAVQRTVGRTPEKLASEAANSPASTTFLETIYAGGLVPAAMSISSFVTGAIGGKKDGFGGGMANLTTSDVTDRMNHRVPQLWTFNSRTKATAQRPVRVIANRDHLPITVFNAGRGKLTYLHGVREVIDHDIPVVDSMQTWKAKTDPWISYSTNHGVSFANAAPAFLLPLLINREAVRTDLIPASPDPFVPEHLEDTDLFDRPYYDNAQLDAMCATATFVYVGDGKCLLFIPNGYVEGVDRADYDDTDGGQDDFNSFAIYKPMIFLGSGSSYSRLSWPADAWNVDKSGARDSGIREGTLFPGLKVKDSVGFSRAQDARTLCWAFGEGCAAIPVVGDDTGWRLLVTRDFGSSWEFAACPEGVVSPTGGGPTLCVIKPYVSSAEPGRILIQVLPAGGNEVVVYKTDGTFAEYKVFARFKTHGSTSPAEASGAGGWEHQLVYTGGDLGPQYVFPAFPGEFEPD